VPRQALSQVPWYKGGMFGAAESSRAALYRQLGSLETAGIPLGTALHKVLDPAARRAAESIDKGEDPPTAWLQAGFSPLEVALVRAGTKGGQLAQNFLELEKIFEERAGAKRRAAMALAYPVGLAHLAVLLPRLSLLISSGVAGYCKATVFPLIGAWAVLIAGYVVLRMFREALPIVADNLLISLPAVGGLIYRRAVARALRVFAALYRAGIPARDAVDEARDAAQVYPVSAAFDRVAKRLDEGLTIGDAFLQESSLPQHVREAASTGALTGRLDETLAGAERLLLSEAQMRQHFIIVAAPVLAFLVVALFVGYSIIAGYQSYFDKINELSK